MANLTHQPLSAARRKWIQSLSSARHRRDERAFIAEGTRCVRELIEAGIGCRCLAATKDWLAVNPLSGGIEVYEASKADIERMSQQQSPQPVIAVFDMPERVFNPDEVGGSLTLALDTIQDPGNMGTIVRVADWFGIRDIVCSPSTVDVYNPKVVQATMGAIARVNVYYEDLTEALPRLGMPIYGTMLDGENLYEADLEAASVIVMGNEGNGIGDDVAAMVDRRILIPPYPRGAETVESLNVGVATAITVAEFRRRLY